MESPSDLSGTLETEVKKPYAVAKKVYKPYSYDGSGRYANINLDPEIIEKLNITDSDEFTQHIVSDGILLRRFKEGI
ncbi:MAG: hypothetical protein WA941_13100 [Nitrososphaeraceae archaeon]